jgi:transposase-like protein
MEETPPKPFPPADEPNTLNVACPHCAAHVGKPVSVTTRRGDSRAVDVTMRCADCNRTWIVQKLTNDNGTPPQ